MKVAVCDLDEKLKRGGDFLENGGLCGDFFTFCQIWFRKGEGPYKGGNLENYDKKRQFCIYKG